MKIVFTVVSLAISWCYALDSSEVQHQLKAEQAPQQSAITQAPQQQFGFFPFAAAPAPAQTGSHPNLQAQAAPQPAAAPAWPFAASMQPAAASAWPFASAPAAPQTEEEKKKARYEKYDAIGKEAYQAGKDLWPLIGGPLTAAQKSGILNLIPR
eukprot:gnl/MRDRNA2_/MRDRNA2_97118_c0_seq1.p1 gnl/MRDRNA2_/MRDRNA2_97118_c0~~gnl/MRDRNA2_/MRDRNA2_97118_c0_seq1.p1  ORF type:complete len:154 (+),score=49.10 gnl/MRDRNA2_/MRDRNA2_97118_c0_seq1:73-534(+)